MRVAKLVGSRLDDLRVFADAGSSAAAPKLHCEPNGLGTGRFIDRCATRCDVPHCLLGCGDAAGATESCPSPQLRRRLMNQRPRIDFVLRRRPQRERPRSCADRGRQQRLTQCATFPPSAAAERETCATCDRASNHVRLQRFTVLDRSISSFWGDQRLARSRILRGETVAMAHRFRVSSLGHEAGQRRSRMGNQRLPLRLG